MKIYTPEDVAEILAIDVDEVERLRRRHKWPHMKAGRFNIRYTEQDMEVIVASLAATYSSRKKKSDRGQTSRSRARR